MAEGDISFITSSLFDAGRGMNPSIVHVSGNVYAIAYRGPDNDGWLITVTISDDGTIIALTGSSLEFNAASGEYPRLIHVTGNIYAIVYTQLALEDGILCTVSIDDSGNIGVAVLNTFTFDAVRGYNPHITHVAGDVYAIAYNGAGDRGLLCTVTIDNVGNIAFIATFTFDDDFTSGHNPYITHVAGDVYAIAYTGAPASRGRLCTVTIDAAGNIGAVATREFDSFAGGSVILHVAGDVYAIVYTWEDNKGKVSTWIIDALGAIDPGSPEGTLIWDDVKGIHPDFIQVSGHVYAIAARGAGDTGWLHTITIEADGQISDLDTLEFDDSTTEDPRLIQVAGKVFAIAYVYFVVPIPGYVATVEIEGEAKGMVGLNPAFMEMMG